MDIDTDVQALQSIQFKPLPSTPASLKFEVKDLSDRIENLIDLRRMSVESLLSLMFSKRAKLFELRDKHMIFSTQDLIHALDLEIQKLQRGDT